jgi:hypothetical protein
MSKKKMHYIDRIYTDAGMEEVAENWQNRSLKPYSDAELASSFFGAAVMRGIMDTRSRTHLEGWRSITRQKNAKLLLHSELENYCDSNTGSDL